MQTILANAQRYDWSTWSMGLMRSFISGGGGALAGFLGPLSTDSKDFNFGTGLGHTLMSMGIGFLISGLVQMGIFLKTHGAPDPLQQVLASAASKQDEARDAISKAQDIAKKE